MEQKSQATLKQQETQKQNDCGSKVGIYVQLPQTVVMQADLKAKHIVTTHATSAPSQVLQLLNAQLKPKKITHQNSQIKQNNKNFPTSKDSPLDSEDISTRELAAQIQQVPIKELKADLTISQQQQHPANVQLVAEQKKEDVVVLLKQHTKGPDPNPSDKILISPKRILYTQVDHTVSRQISSIRDKPVPNTIVKKSTTREMLSDQMEQHQRARSNLLTPADQDTRSIFQIKQSDSTDGQQKQRVDILDSKLQINKTFMVHQEHQQQNKKKQRPGSQMDQQRPSSRVIRLKSDQITKATDQSPADAYLLNPQALQRIQDGQNSSDSLQQNSKRDPNRLYNTETVSSKLKRQERLAYEAKQQELQQKKKKKKAVNVIERDDFRPSSDEETFAIIIPNDHQPKIKKLQMPQSATKASYIPQETDLNQVPPEQFKLPECLKPGKVYEMPVPDQSFEVCWSQQIDTIFYQEPAQIKLHEISTNDCLIQKNEADQPFELSLLSCVDSQNLEPAMIDLPQLLINSGKSPENEIQEQDSLERDDFSDYSQASNPQLLLQTPIPDTSFNLPLIEEAGCQADFDYTSAQDQDDERSDSEDVYETKSGQKQNTKDCGLQTSNIHFLRITNTNEFKEQQAEREFSIDWQFSSIYDDLQFKKKSKASAQQAEEHDCGNQVSQQQIVQETQLQILSEIECQYNAEMLKHKQVSTGEKTSIDRTIELYLCGLNTLQALMFVLRLQKEWETVTRPQYEIDVNLDGSLNLKRKEGKVDEDQCVRLLIRCSKMYEAKQAVMRLLQITLEKDQLVQKLKQEIRQKQLTQAQYKKELAVVRKLGAKITTMANNLQDEHRIMKRPFIIKGSDYLKEIKTEQGQLEEFLQQNYFVDDTKTVGENYQIKQQ